MVTVRDALQELPEVLTVKEARELTGGRIGRNAMYEYIKAGFIPHIKVGKKVLIPKRRFLAWLNGDLAEASRDREPVDAVAPRNEERRIQIQTGAGGTR